MSKESKFIKSLQEDVRHLEAMRRHKERAVDITLEDYVKEKHQVTLSEFYKDLGVDPTRDTIQNLLTMPDTAYRWLIPELYRDAVRLGLRKATIYGALIAGEQNVSQTSVIMPSINMSDATPRKVGVAETISLGEVSFGSKNVKIHKIGRGIKVPYEISQYVSLNLVSIFMQDFGIRMGMGMDSLALSTLINGDQADGSQSAAVVGIKTANTLIFKDLLKIYARGSRLGKTYTTQVAGEDMAVDVMDLLVNTRLEGTQRMNVTFKSAMPQSSDLYVHGQISDNQMLMVDKSSAMIKLNAQPLLVETEKIVSNQTDATYATLTTGFATLFRDARVILDRSVTIQANNFPAWMNPTAEETVIIA